MFLFSLGRLTTIWPIFILSGGFLFIYPPSVSLRGDSFVCLGYILKLIRKVKEVKEYQEYGKYIIYVRTRYVHTLYIPTFVGKHRDTLQLSSSCDLPQHGTATQRSHIGRIRKSPPCRDHKQIWSHVPSHLVGKADCHHFFPTKLLRRLSMVWYILLRKHPRMIPSIVLVSDATALA